MEVSLKPNSRCLCCSSSIDSIGGKRIVRSKNKGLVISMPYKYESSGELITHNENQLFLSVLGWNTQDKTTFQNRAKTTIKQGYYPWFCQRCFGRICPNCNSLQAFPSATEVLSDNGTTTHVPIVTVSNNCINKCKQTYKGTN